jgi:peptidoglycan lytic transglycosylase
MLIRRNANNVNWKSSLQFWLLVATSGVALAGMLVTIPTRTVQADAVLSKPAAPPPPLVVKSPTPVLVEDVQAERRMPAHLLRGVASWYGSVFNGRQTASGEKYDMYAMTACHPTLPFGTKVRVVNMRNHRSVIVRITDRGLLYDGRVMDLSYAAAEKLGMVRSGVAPVKIQILALGHASQ